MQKDILYCVINYINVTISINVTYVTEEAHVMVILYILEIPELSRSCYMPGPAVPGYYLRFLSVS
jgi:hypothetical protein